MNIPTAQILLFFAICLCLPFFVSYTIKALVDAQPVKPKLRPRRKGLSPLRLCPKHVTTHLRAPRMAVMDSNNCEVCKPIIINKVDKPKLVIITSDKE